jgi:hypothetical protein
MPQSICRSLAKSPRRLAACALVAFAALFAGGAQAIPLYARQLGGMACAGCHAGGNFPELTPFGRKFKALGYTLGERTLPLSAMVLASHDRLASQAGSASPDVDFAHDRQTRLQAISLFSGGRISEHTGAFVQWTYDPAAHHGALDNTDLRYARSFRLGGADALWGVTLNNNPSVQDLYNSVPAWAYPYNSPGGAFPGFGAQPLVMGGLAQQVAGLGAYIDWNDFIYAELTGYRTARGPLSVFRAGTYNADPASGGPGPYAVSGTSPYWRVALHRINGAHDWELGAFGFDARQFSDSYNNASPTTHFTDVAIDGQYHYTRGEFLYSAIGTWIHERQRFDSDLIGVTAANARNTLDWRQIKLGLGWRAKYHASVAFFGSTGSADALLYAANLAQRPDTRGAIFELSYLPHPQVKLGIQYVRFNRFNGSAASYDATGTLANRVASDNNTLSLYLWTAF